MDVDEGGPFLGARWRGRVLSRCGVGLGEGFGLGWAVGDADLRGVLRPGWKGYVLDWFAGGVFGSS